MKTITYTGPTAASILTNARAAGSVFFHTQSVSDCLLFAKWLQDATNDPTIQVSGLLKHLEIATEEMSNVEYTPAYPTGDGRFVIGIYEMLSVGMSFVNPQQCFKETPVGQDYIRQMLIVSTNRLIQIPAFFRCH